MLTEQQIKNIPEALKQRNQWIGWKAKPKGNGKIDKLPVDPRTGKVSDANDPSIHCSFEEALDGVKLFELAGPGFVFTEEDPFSGVDLDDCVINQELQAEQRRTVQKLNSYTEFSPTETGVKTFLEGTLPGPNKNTDPIEMYSNSRFFTVPGNILNGNSALVEPRQRELEEVYFQHFPEEIPRFGPLFNRCYLMRFLKRQADSGVNLGHNTRIALASFSNSLNELDTDDLPFIKLMLQGCPDFDPEKTRKQVESLFKGKDQAPWGCEALKKQVQSEFADFDTLRCECNLESREGRKPSPIRFIAPVIAEWVEDDEDEIDFPSIERFPIEVFPKPYQKLVVEVSEAYMVPVEIPACALLSLAGACIGRTRKIAVTESWFQYANLWFAIVGKSGIGKSHPIEYTQRPLLDLENKWFEEYETALDLYQEQLVERKKASKEDKKLLGPKPKSPQWRQVIIDDATGEALTQAFKDNPRGILWSRDELSGLILDLDKYSGKEGGTKARLMSGYDSGPWKLNRVGKRAFIRHACLSMFGGIQPKYLSTIFSRLDADTGFLPRFLFVLTRREKPAIFQDKIMSNQSYGILSDLIHGLLDLDFKDGESIPVYMEPQARALYLDWHTEQATEPWRIYNAEEFEPVLNKLQGQCLRMALNLHYMHLVSSGRSEGEDVAADIVSKAITLTNCFKSHQRRVWDHMIHEKEVLGLDPLAERMLHAIVALEDSKRKSFNRAHN